MHMSTAADDAVADYLEAHIAQARAELEDPLDEIAVRNVLERLGDPQQIAAEEIGTAPAAPAPSIMPALPSNGAAWREPAAIVLLLFGAFAGGVGWLVGVVLLWASPRWTRGDKLLGTLLWPGGLVASFLVVAFYLGAGDPATRCFGAATSGGFSCVDSGGSGSATHVVALGLFALAPFLTAAFLATRLKPRDA